MSASKKKGTAWESAIVGYLRDEGVAGAERRALGGTDDRGDIAGIPAVVVEAKSAARIDLAGWCDEAERERANDGADLGVVWAKRLGKSSPADGYAIMSGATLVRLLRAAGYIPGGDPVVAQPGPSVGELGRMLDEVMDALRAFGATPPPRPARTRGRGSIQGQRATVSIVDEVTR